MNGALGVGEPRVRADVVDHDRLAAAARLEQRLAKRENRPVAKKWRDAAGMTPGDLERLVVDRGVDDATDAQVLAEQARGDVLQLGGIAQGADRLVEPEQKPIVLSHAGSLRRRCAARRWHI